MTFSSHLDFKKTCALTELILTMVGCIQVYKEKPLMIYDNDNMKIT